MDSNNNDIIFFKAWRNIVINTIIFNYSKLYIKNKFAEFNNIKSLREYSEREFISKLEYSGNETLCKGDLPEHGVLNKLDLYYYCGPITSADIFPQGVEIIYLNGDISTIPSPIQLSELPSSVHTIINVALKKPYIDNPIPNSITSISFFSGHFIDNIDPIQFYDLAISNSVVKLDLGCLKYSLSRLSNAPPSYIPSSVTDLTVHYDIRNVSKTPTIPSTVTKLCLDLAGTFNFTKELEIVPFGVKELTIVGPEYGGIILEKDSLPESITKLTIYFGELGIDNVIQPHAIPHSVTNLEIEFTKYPLSYDYMFPPNLTSLVLETCYDPHLMPPLKISSLPTTIKYLKFGYREIDYNETMGIFE